jgi:hypothetical protein
LGTFEEVEAVLLNGGGDPRQEIVLALRATAHFAFLELEATEEQFVSAARAAYTLAKADE